MNKPSAIRLIRYTLVVLRWFLVASVVFVSTLYAGRYLSAHAFSKVYTASASLELPASDLVTPAVDASKPEPVALQPEFENVMTSPDFLLSVIKDLGLDKTWAQRVDNPDEDVLPDQDALTHIEKLLAFEIKPGTKIVKVTVSSDDPKEAADIANTIADHYKTLREAEQDMQNNRGLEGLREEIDQQQQVVDEKNAEVEKLGKDLGDKQQLAVAASEEKDESDLEKLKQDLLSAQEDLDSRSVLFNSVINLTDDQFASTLQGLSRNEVDLDKVQAEISLNKTGIDNLLKAGAKESDARVLALRKETATKQKQFHELVAGLRHAMQADRDMAKTHVDLLQKKVNDLTAKLSHEQTAEEKSYRAAQRDLEQQELILNTLNNRLGQASPELPDPVCIVERAQIPKAPTQPNSNFDYVVTVLAASFLSLTAASFVEIVFLFLRAAERADN